MATNYNNTIPPNTGNAYAPQEGTKNTYLTNATAAPTHTSTTNAGLTSTAGPASAGAGENTGERVARGIKGVVAQGHGMTESLRGNINSGIDSLVGDKEKLPRDEAVARAGDREVLNKEFEKKGTVHKNFN